MSPLAEFIEQEIREREALAEHAIRCRLFVVAEFHFAKIRELRAATR